MAPYYKLVIRGIWACRFICTTQGRDSYPGCEVLFHMHTVAQVLKQCLHSNDVVVGPITPWEVVKLSVTDDEGQTSAAPLLSYWINLQNKGTLNDSHFSSHIHSITSYSLKDMTAIIYLLTFAIANYLLSTN